MAYVKNPVKAMIENKAKQTQSWPMPRHRIRIHEKDTYTPYNKVQKMQNKANAEGTPQVGQIRQHSKHIYPYIDNAYEHTFYAKQTQFYPWLRPGTSTSRTRTNM